MSTTDASPPSKRTSPSEGPAGPAVTRAALMAQLQAVNEDIRELADEGPSEETSSPEEVVEIRRPRRPVVKSSSRVPSDSDEPVEVHCQISVQSSEDEEQPPRNRPRVGEWIVATEPCDQCNKSGKQCEKPANNRRTACRSCSTQKKQCIWPGGPVVKAKRGPARSPKPKEGSEQAPDYTVVQSMEQLRQDVVATRRELADLRVEVVALQSGQAKILAQHADAKKQMDRLEALLRSLKVPTGDEMDIST